jgi:SAM-dependent methyltransferase
MRTFPLTVCPGCGSDAASEFQFGAEHTLRRCEACDLVYAPEYGDPDEIYVEGYLMGTTDFGLDVSDPYFQEYLTHVARLRMEVIERAIGGHGRSLLDVGCGTGEVLAAARDRGWTVQGVDPVAESAEVARSQRGLDVRTSLLEESGLPERSYDVVSAFHVLEHMNDGAGFLRLIARWARPGGHVVIEVPNWRSFHRRGAGQVGTTWPNLRPLEHVAHYTPATLAATMRQVGLEPTAVLTRSYVWDGQSWIEQLRDVGHQRYRGWARLLGREEVRNGNPVTVPNAVGRAALRAIEKVQDRAGTGVVVLAIARVP